MDFLKKELAPISSKGWMEIEKRAKDVLSSQLSGRRFLKVVGPLGKSSGGVSTGRLVVESEDGKEFGIYQTQPYIENRINFTLNRWELDNIDRGAQDINFDSLDEAVKEAAKFEEKAVYYGLDKACILGILDKNKEMVDFGKTEAETLKNVMYGVSKIRNQGFSSGPFVLVVGLEKYIHLNTINPNYSLLKKIEKVLGAPVIVSHNITEGILLPYNCEDVQLVLGEDFSIGYQEHSSKEVKLFITETFTFRNLDPSSVVLYK